MPFTNSLIRIVTLASLGAVSSIPVLFGGGCRHGSGNAAPNVATQAQSAQSDGPGAGASAAPAPSTPSPCAVGTSSPDAQDATLQQLSESPDQFLNKRVRVAGYLLDLYEGRAIVDGHRKYSVAATWTGHDIRACKGKRVVAEGFFRDVPNSRARRVVHVDAIRDENEAAAQTVGGNPGDAGAPQKPTDPTSAGGSPAE